MRWHEIESGMRVYTSGEEQNILDRASKNDLDDGDLDERDQEVARQMVSRGLLRRVRSAKGVCYQPSRMADIGRDQL